MTPPDYEVEAERGNGLDFKLVTLLNVSACTESTSKLRPS
jgi:hypothetical protein